jgi:hypothetical protein
VLQKVSLSIISTKHTKKVLFGGGDSAPTRKMQFGRAFFRCMQTKKFQQSVTFVVVGPLSLEESRGDNNNYIMEGKIIGALVCNKK